MGASQCPGRRCVPGGKRGWCSRSPRVTRVRLYFPCPMHQTGSGEDVQEKLSLRLLPEHPLPVREQRLRRKVANDALVDVDTVRYSVPHALVRQNVEVLVLVDRVDIFHNRTLIASHERSREPHAIVRQASHYDGLWKSSTQGNQEVKNEVSELRKMGRSLQDYADVIGGDS